MNWSIVYTRKHLALESELKDAAGKTSLYKLVELG